MRWLGIDGGGTKTACSIYDESLDRLDRIVLTTCHYAQVGLDGMERVLRDGILWAQASGHLDGMFGIGLSLCGYGEDAHADTAIRDIVATLAGQNPYALVNDVEAAWAAGLDMTDGIALIAGTGSIAYGVHSGRTMRCGGWDYEIGDEGSGGWMGKELLRAFTRQADGRDARGPLYDLVRRELDLHDDFDIIPFARHTIADRTRIAALSRLVTDAARAGDASAAAIMTAAAREEADMVRAIVKGIFEDADDTGSIPVAYIGGTFNAGELVLEPLRTALPTSCRLIAPAHEPELGAALILRARMDGVA